MMRQHSKVVHASSAGDRAAQVQERMASSISVDWGVKRAPQNPTVVSVEARLTGRGSRFHNRESPQRACRILRLNRTDINGLIRRRLRTLRWRGKMRLASMDVYLSKLSNLRSLNSPSPKVRRDTDDTDIDEPMYFSCTLDNGLHCVTTPFKLLQVESKIDQEFELSVCFISKLMVGSQRRNLNSC